MGNRIKRVMWITPSSKRANAYPHHPSTLIAFPALPQPQEEPVGPMSSSSENFSVSSDSLDDVTSSTSTSSSSLSNKDDQFEDGPLNEMSSLIAQLPFKRGLSRFYNGKSRSFTSLSNVRSLEDLAKPERQCRKRVKLSNSYGGGLDGRESPSPNGCSETITKKVSRGPSFSASARSRLSIPPQKSSNFF